MKKLILSLVISSLAASDSGCAAKPFKDFDVAARTFDANAFPLNPKWGKQAQQNVVPDPAASCPITSDSDNTNDWTQSSQFPNCTSFPVTFNGGIFCGPHVNFMPVTYQGTVVWDDHSSSLLDDDYTMNVRRGDDALYTTVASRVHIEFNSDETVDNWDDTGTWWNDFHHNAVDNGKASAQARIDGLPVIVTGLLSLDAMHGGKTELHPVYAMFVNLKSDDPSRSSWAFFVRNWGDEGFCGSDDQPLPEHKIAVRIPGAVSLVASNIWEGAQNTDQLSPMGIGIQPYADAIQVNAGGELLSFTLLPAGDQSWFVGDLTFAMSSPTTNTSRVAAAGTIGRETAGGDNDERANPDLTARIARLSENDRAALTDQLHRLVTRRRPRHVQPAIVAETATFDETPRKAPVLVTTGQGTSVPRTNSPGKARQRSKIEVITNFLDAKNVR